MSESIDLRKLILEYLSQDALLSSKEIHEGVKQIAAYATVTESASTEAGSDNTL